MPGWGSLLLCLSCVSLSIAACNNTESNIIHANSSNETLTLSCQARANYPLVDHYWEYVTSGFHLVTEDCAETSLSSTCMVTNLMNGVIEMKLTHVIRPVPDGPVCKICAQQCNTTVILPSTTSMSLTITSTIYTSPSPDTSTLVTQHTTSSLAMQPSSSHITHHDTVVITTTTTAIMATSTAAPRNTPVSVIIAVVVITVCAVVLVTIILTVIAVWIWMSRRKKPPVDHQSEDLDNGFLVSPETQNFFNDNEIDNSRSHGHRWDAFLMSKRKIFSLFKGNKRNSKTSLLEEDEDITIETGLSSRSSSIPSESSVLQREETIRRTNPLANPHALKQAHPLEVVHTATDTC